MNRITPAIMERRNAQYERLREQRRLARAQGIAHLRAIEAMSGPVRNLLPQMNIAALKRS
jgi:hypothetical protein